MKILFTLLLAILLHGHSLAQNKSDSLKSVWFNDNIAVSIRANAISDLIENYFYTDTDSALIWAETFLIFSQQKQKQPFI